MAGNLVGFVVGVEGIGPLLRDALGRPRFLAGVGATLFCAAQLMFAQRAVEARRGARRERERERVREREQEREREREREGERGVPGVGEG
jgi:hypothetical protein